LRRAPPNIPAAGSSFSPAATRSLPADLAWIGTSRRYEGDLDDRTQHVVRPEDVGVRRAPDGLHWTRSDTFQPNSLFFRASCFSNVACPTAYNYNEDMYFRFLLSSLYDGAITDAVTTAYRIWEHQAMHPGGVYYDDKLPRLMLILDEINAFRAVHGHGPLAHPY
jgi:hypothetical protein